MERIQTMHKLKLKEFLERLQESPEWKICLKRNEIEDLKWEVMSERHYPEVVTLMCSQFTMYGRASNHLSLHISIEDSLKRFKPLVASAIKLGTSFVVVSRHTNRVVMAHFVWDVLDEPLKEHNTSTSLQSVRTQINDQVVIKHPRLRNDIFDANMRPLKHIKYGQVRYLDVMVADPTVQKQGLGKLNFIVLHLENAYSGYSIGYAVITNPAIETAVKQIMGDSAMVVDYSNFTFDRQCKDKDESFSNMNDVYSRLQNKFGLTPQYVNYVKQRSKILVYAQDLRDQNWWNRLAQENPCNLRDVILKFAPRPSPKL